MKRWLQNALLLAVSTVLGFGVVEVILRVFDTAPTYSVDHWDGNRSVIIDPEFKLYSERNSLGLREYREFSKSSKARRVVFLGDSFVYGVGVSNHETFAYVTEQLLNDTSARPWQIINAGWSGTGAILQLQRLKDILKELEVDAVVLFCFVDNDPYDTLREHERVKQGLPAEPLRISTWCEIKKWAYFHSATYRFLRLRFATVGTLREFPYFVFDQCDPAKLAAMEPMDALMRDALSEMKSVLAARGADLSAVIIPRADRISDAAFAKFKKTFGVADKPYDRSLPDKRIAQKVFAPLGIDVLDLLPVFEGKEPDDFYYPVNAHFNKRGNRLVAEQAAAWLKGRFTSATAHASDAGQRRPDRPPVQGPIAPRSAQGHGNGKRGR